MGDNATRVGGVKRGGGCSQNEQKRNVSLFCDLFSNHVNLQLILFMVRVSGLLCFVRVSFSCVECVHQQRCDSPVKYKGNARWVFSGVCRAASVAPSFIISTWKYKTGRWQWLDIHGTAVQQHDSSC